MKPPPFEYVRPDSLEAALEILAERGPDASVLAGGQSLVPAMNFRLAAPAMLVDLNRVPDLAYAVERDGGVAIGSMTRQRAVERSALVARRAPLLAEALGFVAHPQIRNRGTIGGSLAHADPAAELPAVAVALGARLRARSVANPEGRWIDADDFFPGLFTSALEPDEILVEVAFPAPPPRTGQAFEEFARRHGDYALAGAAAVVTLDGAGRCGSARIALLSVADGPLRATAAEAALTGAEPNQEAVRSAADDAAREVDPPADIHATAAYRRHLVGVLVRRALARAVERARRSAGPEPGS